MKRALSVSRLFACVLAYGIYYFERRRWAQKINNLQAAHKRQASSIATKAPQRYNAYNCTKHVSIRGIASLVADIMPSSIRADADSFVPDDYGGMLNGSIVFVTTSNLGKFVKFIPQRNIRIVLITGAGVLGVPQEVSELQKFDWRVFMRLHVIKWYAQNYDLNFSLQNLLPLPLGVNFHTLVEAKHAHLWGAPRSECEQDRQLQKIADAAPLQRDPRIFVPRMAKMHRHGNDREEAYKHLNPRSKHVSFQKQPMRRNELWMTMSRYRFVVSPLGMGMDCHRTWEALALGCIPIVRRSTLVSSLFKGVPIISVKRWEDVNAKALSQWSKEMQNITVNEIQRYARLDAWLPVFARRRQDEYS